MARLQGGTRIYGTANVDTSIVIGGNVVVNSSALSITGNTTTAPTAIFQGANVIIGNSSITGAPQAIFANSLGNTIISTTSFVLSNSTAVPFTANLSGLYHSGTINAASHTVGTSFIANATQLTTTYPTVHTANVSVNGAIIANGGAGTSGQVLTSSAGGNVYWSTASGGGGGFTNGQSISVANLAVTGSLTANGSVGTSGQALVSTGTGVQWGTSSPGYNYSSQFNGSNQYFSVGTTSDFKYLHDATSDWTVECWVYPTTLNTTPGQFIIATDAETAYIGTFICLSNWANGDVAISVNRGVPGSYLSYSTAANTVVINTWQHIALTFTSSTKTYAIYVNGVSKSLILNGTASGSFAYSTANHTYPLNVGRYVTGSASGSYFPGFISNLRIVKSVVYTGNFTTPTTPLSAIANTTLLTCNSITPTDSSTNNFIPTNNGVFGSAVQSPFASTTVSIPTASLTAVRQQFTGDGSTTSFSVAGGYTANAISVFVNGVLLRNGTEVTVTNGSTVVFAIAPLNGALIDVIGTVPTTYSSITPVSYSVSFTPASSQYLNLASNAAFGFGTGDFTVELWVYSNALPGYLSPLYHGAVNNAFILNYNTSGNLIARSYGVADLITSSSTLPLNSWNHVAVTRNGTTLTIWLNGVSIGTASNSTTFADSAVYIARGDSGVAYFNGYISNLRVVKGVAVYTGAFTPPKTPLTIVQSAVAPSIQAITGTQTSLLTCNGPTIIDGSTNAFTITNNGSAPVSTAIVPTFTNVTINNTSALSLAGVQSSNFTAQAGYIYPVNTTSATVTVTLPASPIPGQKIAISDYAGTFATYNCTINPNGNKISGSTSNIILPSNREGAAIVYVDSTQGWLGYGNFVSNPVGPYQVEVLIVAGGGGGGIHSGGGGGAGGLLYYGSESPKTPSGIAITVTPGGSYSLVVGSGGASSGGPYQSVTGSGGDGGSSSAFGYTAIGGGGGGSGGNAVVGRNGGSGGGGGRSIAAGSGTSGQGFAGGVPGTASTANYPGGGGGGASAVGTGGNTGQGGNGGDGLAYVISGASTYYGGGGGGNLQAVATVQGTGGLGGGGAGVNGAGVAGTVNTGGGGGGANYDSSVGGGTGGSGIIIIRYLGSQRGYGGNSITTTGGYTIHKFTASGTYTA